MKKRRANRIQKSRIIKDEEKQLLDFMASLIVEIILRENIDQTFDVGVETENKPK
ncbi:MAG: hypothetical protein J7577_07810 [Sphingobacteriaceae bacterium]|nr:hypothetical protein [Sphingobacteriaceae bacterium]